ncbi:conserved membrane hypothetical protein [uncultured Alphaproteobacteria bacterium]|uniref:NfeD-like C-terminal domain-containing protein n=1 Tax=uncultured Alphaproteobacteria bacterium TaxID=91750 RepID=A0A212KLD8_9PROT|nr:conserved membrane hypothetical protein [uncultured Alphaproteobacteria bacterium]
MTGLLALPLDHWHWWIAAVVMFVVEMAMPGILFLWLGLAALITGVVAFAGARLGHPPGWEAQALTFAVLAVASLALARRLRGRVAAAPGALNRRGEDLIGRDFVLAEAIVNGQGRVRVGDTLWIARGPELPAGARVRVTGVEGATLMVAAFTEP